jgi:hypothetical protein
MSRSTANRINRMSRPWLYDAIDDFAGGGDAGFLNAYKFDLRPTTDDRPFFHNYLRWRTVPEILPLMRSGGMPLLEAGYLMLVAVFLQALALGFVLIVLPLAIGRSRVAIRREPALSARVVVYFAAIGLAFMFMELAAIHRFILFLEQPVYASAAVIGAFLVFAGAGSLASKVSADRLGRRAAAALGAGGAVFVGMLWLLFLDEAVRLTAGESLGFRLLLAVAFIGPLAFAMGHLFPSAVAELAGSRPDLVPWAWAINGCASVVGAVSATMISVAIGFDNCLVIALSLYLVTVASFPRPAANPR